MTLILDPYFKIVALRCRIIRVIGMMALIAILSGRAHGDWMLQRNIITRQLAGKDRVTALRAFNRIEQHLSEDFAQMRWLVIRVWPMALMRGRHYNMAARLALDAATTFPQDMGLLQQVMELRIHALLRAHHPRTALASALSLFNVCAMRSTHHALLLLAECLSAVYPHDPQMIQELMNQQVAGAIVPAPGGSKRVCTMFKSIPIKRKLFAKPLEELQPFTDYNSLLARGNLLLLAGQGAKAMRIFRSMVNQYGADRVGNECIARAFKAEDGTIGRANSWVLALKKAQAAQSGAAR